MHLLIDYIPIVAFIFAYFYKDIFFATGVLMAVMPVVLLLQWLMTRKVNKIYLASTVLVLVLGSATLAFRNPTFLYWKPTVLNWLIAFVFLGSQWIGEKTVVQRMLGNAAELNPDQTWPKSRQTGNCSEIIRIRQGITPGVSLSFPSPTYKFDQLRELPNPLSRPCRR